MLANLIKIGNSKGIILPSKLLKLIGLKDKVRLEVHDDKILITPAKSKPREGWEEMIKTEVQKSGQPKRLMPDYFDDEKTNSLQP